MRLEIANPIVHLELRTPNLPQACAFYTGLLGWSAQTIRWGPGSYVALELAEGIGGGVVEQESERPLWIPYIEVADLGETVAAACRLGGSVTLEPREGPAGWRSVLTAPGCGELALWQPKT
jgi:predicted enzyme related to lactoylglutathione lyase